MRNICILVIILFLKNITCNSSIIEPSNSVSLNRNEITRIDFSIYDEGLSDFGIHYLKFSENQSTSIWIIYLGTAHDYGYFGIEMYFLDKLSFQYDLSRSTIIDSELERIASTGHMKESAGELIHDATSILINNQWLELENSSYSENNDCGNTRLYYYFCNIGAKLFRVILSPNRKYIGGSVYYDAFGDFDTNWYILGIWDTETGKNIYLGDSRLKDFLPNDKFSVVPSISIEIGFSPDNRFFYSRGVNFYFNSIAQLINIETMENIPVSRDVAFTSDSRYYVTERDGLPTLVEAQTGKTIQQYKIPSPMTAVTFSPDDKKLYIAVESAYNRIDEGFDTIYIFDSQLPTSSVPDWDCME